MTECFYQRKKQLLWSSVKIHSPKDSWHWPNRDRITVEMRQKGDVCQWHWREKDSPHGWRREMRATWQTMWGSSVILTSSPFREGWILHFPPTFSRSSNTTQQWKNKIRETIIHNDSSDGWRHVTWNAPWNLACMRTLKPEKNSFRAILPLIPFHFATEKTRKCKNFKHQSKQTKAKGCNPFSKSTQDHEPKKKSAWPSSSLTKWMACASPDCCQHQIFKPCHSNQCCQTVALTKAKLWHVWTFTWKCQPTKQEKSSWTVAPMVDKTG